MSVTARILLEGSKYSICEILKGNRSYIEDFVKDLPQHLKSRLLKQIEYIAEQGPPRNETKFKHEEDAIYAIKQGQIRVYCFFDADRLILLTHGALKKKQKANPEDIARAKRLREEYLKAKESK